MARFLITPQYSCSPWLPFNKKKNFAEFMEKKSSINFYRYTKILIGIFHILKRRKFNFYCKGQKIITNDQGD